MKNFIQDEKIDHQYFSLPKIKSQSVNFPTSKQTKSTVRTHFKKPSNTSEVDSKQASAEHYIINLEEIERKASTQYLRKKEHIFKSKQIRAKYETVDLWKNKHSLGQTSSKPKLSLQKSSFSTIIKIPDPVFERCLQEKSCRPKQAVAAKNEAIRAIKNSKSERKIVNIPPPKQVQIYQISYGSKADSKGNKFAFYKSQKQSHNAAKRKETIPKQLRIEAKCKENQKLYQMQLPSKWETIHRYSEEDDENMLQNEPINFDFLPDD